MWGLCCLFIYSFLPCFPFLSPCHNPEPLLFRWNWGGSAAACLICSRPHVFSTNCSHISLSFPLLLERKTIRKPQMGAIVHWSHPWLQLPSQFILVTESLSLPGFAGTCAFLFWQPAACLSQLGRRSQMLICTWGHTHKKKSHIYSVIAVKRVFNLVVV